MQWSAPMLGQFLAALPDAALVVDGGDRITVANACAAQLFACRPEELPGRSVAFLRAGAADGERARDGGRPLPPSLAGASTVTEEVTLRRCDGQLFPAEVSAAPITVDGRTLTLAILRDVSDRRRVADDLRKSEERLCQATRVAGIGIFDHDHRTDVVFWSPRQREIYGWGADEQVTLPSFLAVLHPGDRDAIAAAMRRAHDPAGDGSFDVEHRITRRDGATRWIATRSRTLFAGEGAGRRPLRTVGASVDLTDRKLVEEELALFRHSVEQASEAVYWLERDGSFRYVNQHACDSLGYTRPELMSMSLWDIDVGYPRASWDARWADYERSRESVGARLDVLHRRKDGTIFPVEVVGQHIALRDRTLHIAYTRDISERRQAE